MKFSMLFLNINCWLWTCLCLSAYTNIFKVNNRTLDFWVQIRCSELNTSNVINKENRTTSTAVNLVALLLSLNTPNTIFIATLSIYLSVGITLKLTNTKFVHFIICSVINIFRLQVWITLTHYIPVLLIYTPWKHKKTFTFSDAVRRYR